MSSLNKVQLIGRLGKDPEIRYTNDNIAVAKLAIATSETYKDKTGAKQDITEWHNVVCWRNLAEIAEKYLTKGKLIYIEGKLRTRNWEDKEGIKRYITEVIADNFIMLDRRESSEQHHTEPTPQKAAENNVTPESNNPEDDLPF
jgi:single-strand DNA-binding protein